MINFEKFTLDNGLRVIVHKDKSTQIVAMNLLYDVGARDEDPDRTGFAHLFEHLMFGGSVNIPKYDTPLEEAGGENNAFTNNDITNYYLTIPRQNLELAFWLESDRMLDLAFSAKSLEVQRNVVIEEFKQSYLNQPYGDVWLLLRPMAYKVHPYLWATIGKDISHIEKATMQDVKDFYKKYYNPNNAILTVAGDVSTDEIHRLSEKWFGPIEPGMILNRNLPKEPRQTEVRSLKVERDVPFDALYKTYHMCARNHDAYHTTDLISDILSNGDSSRLFNRLVKEKNIFSDIHAYISGDRDEGLFVFSGKLVKGVRMEDAEKAINTEIDIIKNDLVAQDELEKVKNKIESTLEFSEISVLNKAMNLSYSELLGDADLINQEKDLYAAVTRESVRETANEIFREDNSSTLYYFSN
ncbi:MAG TPA: pitrilysin family protein [Bacteroidales bacterium]|nr:insulinase family protein [Bacteroidales bacterium]HPE57549.1 pitrilysin family protein [Bacteroidales bacterium]HRX97901.1 pitrilysin family protein [Bacteroidales bacterium]